MKILFLNKGDINQISGGYIYNKEIISFGERIGYEIMYSDKLMDGYDFHIVDSLMFNDASIFRNEHLIKTIALVHQMPKEGESVIEQKLTIGERNMLKYIATGTSVQYELTNNWSVNPDCVGLVAPGVLTDWKSKLYTSDSIANLIMVANYLPKKGYENLSKLVPTIYDLDLNIDCYGNMDLDKEYYHQLSEHIKSIDPENRIRLHDTISRYELNEQYLKADLLISLSESESFGMAIYEALCSKLPVLIFKTGQWQEFSKYSIAEVIDNGDMNSYKKRLTDLVNSTKLNDNLPNEIHEIRTWDKVGEEFYSYCQKWLSS